MISKDVEDYDDFLTYNEYVNKSTLDLNGFYHSYGFSMLGFLIFSSVITGKLFTKCLKRGTMALRQMQLSRSGIPQLMLSLDELIHVSEGHTKSFFEVFNGNFDLKIFKVKKIEK